MKKLNELQAWQYLVKCWSNPTDGNYTIVNGSHCSALCMSVIALHNITSFSTREKMSKKIDDYLSRHKISTGYYWPRYTKEGVAARLKFCKDRVKQILKHKKSKNLQPSDKKLSERQAWLLLAKYWKEPVSVWTGMQKVENIECKGLCVSINAINNKITTDTRIDMFGRLSDYRKKHHKYYMYVWPTTQDGAKERVKFCQDQARKSN